MALRSLEYFKGLPLNSTSVVYLEGFLHWLTQDCSRFSQEKNDYLMEGMNLYRPDRWFQQD